jgi:hypothetical protein
VLVVVFLVSFDLGPFSNKTRRQEEIGLEQMNLPLFRSFGFGGRSFSFVNVKREKSTSDLLQSRPMHVSHSSQNND